MALTERTTADVKTVARIALGVCDPSSTGWKAAQRLLDWLAGKDVPDA